MWWLLRGCYELLLDNLFPVYCCHCRKLGNILCDNCFEQCEFLLSPPVLRLEPCYLDGVQSALTYAGPTKSLIKSLKYQSVRAGGELGGKLVFHTLQLPKVEAVMAVPLHRQRLRERGFNQAKLIAISLAQAAGLRYAVGLQRVVNSRHQASLESREQRLAHQHGHFVALTKPKNCSTGNTHDPQHISNRSGYDDTQTHESGIASSEQSAALLVDDVLTTGATLNECARVLKAAGWARVYGVTLAHGQS